MNLAHVARAFRLCIFAASAALLWRVCAAQLRERHTLDAIRVSVWWSVAKVCPLPPEIQKKIWWKVSTVSRSVCVWICGNVAPVKGTPPPFLRPFRRSLSERGSLACRTLSPRRIVRRFAHVVYRAACSRVPRVLVFASRRLAVQPSPRGRYLPRTYKKYKNMGKMRKKKRFLGVSGVVYKLFIIYIWSIEKNRGFCSLEKRPGRVFLGTCNGVIQNRYLKFRSVQPNRKRWAPRHEFGAGFAFIYPYII